jgi:hypothetical protein
MANAIAETLRHKIFMVATLIGSRSTHGFFALTTSVTGCEGSVTKVLAFGLVGSFVNGTCP